MIEPNQPTPPPIQVLITMNPSTGNVTLTGPMDNPILVGRMLNAGHDVLIAALAAKAGPPKPNLVLARETPRMNGA